MTMNVTKHHGSGARRPSRRAPLVVLAAALAIGAAACSSSGSAGSSASGSASANQSGNGATTAADLAPFLPGKKAAGAPVKIGLINNEGSSPTAEPSVGDAAEAAADYANAELGGIAGHPIQVIRCAVIGDTASATGCANEMVQDKVAAVVIGSTGLGQTMVPIITGAGIPYVSAIGSATAELTTPGAFMWSGGYVSTLTGFAKYAAQRGYKKVTAYVIEAPSAILGAQQIGAPLFKAQHISLTVAPVTADVADATSQVTAGLRGKPDAVMVVADEGTCTSVLQALTTVAPNLPKMVINSCLNKGTLTAVGSAMNGVKVFGIDAIQTNDAEAQLYRYVMGKYWPTANPTGYTVTGYQGMLGLVRATAGLAGEPIPASITAAIKAAKNVPLPAGDGLTFTCNGKQLAGLASVCSNGEVVLTVSDGEGLDPQIIK
jgi:branched-chain amino acid transport system substrate-binding protein